MSKIIGTEKFEGKGMFQTLDAVSKTDWVFAGIGICFGLIVGYIVFKLYDGILSHEGGEVVLVIDTGLLVLLAVMSFIVVFFLLLIGIGNQYFCRKAESADYGAGVRATVAVVEGPKGTTYMARVAVEMICPECGHAVSGTDPRYCTRCGRGMDAAEE